MGGFQDYLTATLQTHTKRQLGVEVGNFVGSGVRELGYKLWLHHRQLWKLFHLLGLQLPLHKMGTSIVKERCCEQNGKQSVNNFFA